MVPLGDVVEFLDHLRKPVTASDRVTGPYPYYGANGQQGSIDGYIFDEPLLLLAEDGGHFGDPDRGIAYRISGPAWVNNHAHVLRMKHDVDLGWAYFALANLNVSQYVTGTTRTKLTKAGAAKIEIPVPSLDEQRRLAAILDQADALRAKHKQILSYLDEEIDSVFADMFQRRTTEETVPLSQVVNEFRYGTSIKSSAAGCPVLRIPNVIGGSLNLSEIKTVQLDDAEFQRLRLVDGDLLFVRTNGNPGNVGRCAVFDSDAVTRAGLTQDQVVYASYLIRARLATDRINPFFASTYLNGVGRRQLTANSKTSAGQYNINIAGLGSVRMPIPPMSSQESFVRKAHAIESMKSYHRRMLEEHGALFRTLQKRALNEGRL